MAAPIAQITFPLKIPNISKLESIFSQEVFVQNIPWTVRISKELIDGKPWLGAFLYCKQKGVAAGWSCSACFKIKLKSFDKNVNPIERTVDPEVFDSTGMGFGFSKWIKWHDLLGSSYVKDDKIKLKIKIKAADPMDETRTKLAFVARDRIDLPLAIYSMTLTNVDKLMAVRSSIFKIRNLPFDLTVFINSSAHLQICVGSKMPASNGEMCNMQVTCKLLSFKADVDPIEKFKSKKLCVGDIFNSDEIISWEALFDPKNGFVDGNAIKIQVKIEVDTPDEMFTFHKKRHVQNNGANMLPMECVICYDEIMDQSVSSTACGHVFCTPCIATEIGIRKVCPCCKLPISEEKVHRVYLPIRN